MSRNHPKNMPSVFEDVCIKLLTVASWPGLTRHSTMLNGVMLPVASENPIQIDSRSAAESEHHRRMIALGLLFLRLLCDRFKPQQQLEAEILVLRHQLNILQQRAPGRPHFRWVDRALFIWLYRRCPLIITAITVVRPETVLRWHRMGFAAYWRWKSRSRGGRPRIAKEMRDLIRRMSLENPLWGACRSRKS